MAAVRYRDKAGDVWTRQPDGTYKLTQWENGSQAGGLIQVSDLGALMVTYGPLTGLGPEPEPESAYQTRGVYTLTDNRIITGPWSENIPAPASAQDAKEVVDLLNGTEWFAAETASGDVLVLPVASLTGVRIENRKVS